MEMENVFLVCDLCTNEYCGYSFETIIIEIKAKCIWKKKKKNQETKTQIQFVNFVNAQAKPHNQHTSAYGYSHFMFI